MFLNEILLKVINNRSKQMFPIKGLLDIYLLIVSEMIYTEFTARAETHHLELLTEKPINSSMYYMTYCQASME